MRTTMFVAVTAVLVAGCSGATSTPHRSGTPSTRPSAAVSVTPTRTGPLTTGAGVLPGERPPIEPAIAKTKTDAGALAFAMYYEHALDWSLATSDPYLLREISAPACETCMRYIRSLDDLRKRNGHVIGGRITVGTASIVTGHTLVKADAVIKVDCMQGQTSVALPSQSPSKVSKSGESTVSFIYLIWRGREWLVAGDFGP